MSLNNNDYIASTGKVLDSGNNVKNWGDGIDQNGDQHTITDGSKVVGPTLIDTVPYGAFTASTTTYKQYNAVLNRGAKKRSFIVTNTLNQPTTTCTITPYESTTRQGTGGIGGDACAVGVLSTSATYGNSSDAHQSLSMNVDSFQVSIGMGSTVPISGNVYIYVTEVF